MSEVDPPAAYEVGFDLGPTYARVRLRGEIDFAAHPGLAEELAAAALLGRPLLIIDLDEVTFLAISGIRLLLTVDSHMTARGGRLATVCRRPDLRRLLELAGLDRRLAVVPSLTAALGTRAAPPTPAASSRHWIVRHTGAQPRSA